jgi:hypothetical protein
VEWVQRGEAGRLRDIVFVIYLGCDEVGIL